MGGSDYKLSGNVASRPDERNSQYQVKKEHIFCSKELRLYITKWLDQIDIPPWNPDAPMPAPATSSPAPAGDPAQAGPNASDETSATTLDMLRGPSPSRETPEKSSNDLVGKSDYVENNLAKNNIFLLEWNFWIKDPRPQRIIELCNAMEKPSTNDGPGYNTKTAQLFLRGLAGLMGGCTEHQVHTVFLDEIYNHGSSLSFQFTHGILDFHNTLLDKRVVPGAMPREDGPRITTPKPDALFGYDTRPGFTKFSTSQLEAGQRMKPAMGQVVSQCEGPCFPFLVAEFKSTKGNYEVAVNQCVGGLVAGLEMVDRLNKLSERDTGKPDPVDDACFGVIMNHRLAEVYVAWKDGPKYLVANAFGVHLAMSTESQMNKFRDCLRNIMDWGKGRRLEAIQETLDAIGAAGRDRQAAAEPPARKVAGGAKRPCEAVEDDQAAGNHGGDGDGGGRKPGRNLRPRKRK